MNNKITRKIVITNFNDLESIKKSEKLIWRLINSGYNLKKTSAGFSTSIFVYEKNN